MMWYNIGKEGARAYVGTESRARFDENKNAPFL